ncbi:MAG TPA: DUF4058 family protein [Gemmataceae bacterium]|nr:DUF4058 family protein [Gemmataceae bacterium]
MPLRDHFHSPVNDHHTWDELHGQWPAMMVLQLARDLPANYLAAPRIHLGRAVEIDVAAFDHQGGHNGDWPAVESGGTATAIWTTTEPTLRVETDLPDVDEYEVRVYDVARDRRLVAAVELVSPSNKDRPETRRAFVAKCAARLQQQVSVAVVDLVTTRDFNLYAELLSFLGRTDSSVGNSPTPTYAVACRGTIPRQRWLLEAWHRPLKIGQPLPALPLWLAHGLAVELDLETTYEDTCRVLRIP